MHIQIRIGYPPIKAWSYLKATKTVSAFCAFFPNTLSKNREATVVPEFRMSAFEDALYW